MVSKIKSIENIVVIGSGTMGRTIAAQIASSAANHASQVKNILLLDIAKPGEPNKNIVADTAREALLDMKPPPLSHHSNIRFLDTGNLDDDLDKVSKADLIIEVIIEDLSIKHQLYDKLQKYIKPTALLASNTSTLPLRDLNKNLPEDLKKRFYIVHFFNPPRYLELLELVLPIKYNPEDRILLENFLSLGLGKQVITCNDTPGFIANRIGCFILEYGVRLAIERKLNPAFIDKILNKLFGFPSTGIFGLYDLVGHDVMRLISNSLTAALSKEDLYNKVYKPNNILEDLLASGRLGRKTGAGFYKLSDSKLVLHLSFEDLEYHVPGDKSLGDTDSNLSYPWNIQIDNIKDLFAHKTTDSNNRLLRKLASDRKVVGDLGAQDQSVLDVHEDMSTKSTHQSPAEVEFPKKSNGDSIKANDPNQYADYCVDLFELIFKYVITLIPSVTENAASIDSAIRLGYNLKYGPFELFSLISPYLNLDDDIKSEYNLHIERIKEDTTQKLDNSKTKEIRVIPYSNRLLRKLASDRRVAGGLSAQDLSVLDVHEDMSTKSTHQSPAEVEFPKKSHATKTSNKQSLINITYDNKEYSSILKEFSRGEGESYYVFEILTKMGTLNESVFTELIQAIDRAEQNNKELYITSSAKIFSAGADLKFFRDKIIANDFDSISKLIKLGQTAMLRLKYSLVPTTSVVHGTCLGGGAEILLHSQNILAHQNLNAGLPEASLGIIPGFCGTKEMLLRGAHDKNILLNNITNILLSRKSSSAEYFNELYGTKAKVAMNRFKLIDLALDMEKKQNNMNTDIYKDINIEYIDLKSSLKDLDKLNEFQIDLINFFQAVIDKGNYSEHELSEIEHDKFIELCKNPSTLTKISHLLMN